MMTARADLAAYAASIQQAWREVVIRSMHDISVTSLHLEVTASLVINNALYVTVLKLNG